MHKNYYLYEKQVNQIKPMILGKTIENIFTFQKNELLIELGEPRTHYLLINISVERPHFLLKPIFNISHSKYQLFQEIRGRIILDVMIHPYDKHITLDLGPELIEIYFYGKRPNIFLYDRNQKPMNSFKNGQPPQNIPDKSWLDFRTMDSSQLQKVIAASITSRFEDFLKNSFAALNNLLISEICFRTNLDRDKTLINLTRDDLGQLLSVFGQIKEELVATDNCVYVYDNGHLTYLSIIRLEHLEKNQPVYKSSSFKTVNEAWQYYINQALNSQKLDKIYHLAYQSIQKRIDYLNRSLAQLQKNENLQQRKSEAELKGNLLLTFKNNLNIQKNEVVVENIFSENLEKIRIKVNPQKSPVENAQIYFTKFKNLERDKFLLTIKKNTLLRDLEEMNDLNKELAISDTLPKIVKLHNKLIEMGLIQSAKGTSSSSQSLRYLFKHYILDKGWEIFIGRSGENNEILTFHFANKWDLWLHAQDVSGSHVILRLPVKNQKPPLHIIEQAAQFAATYSQAKHSLTVPVIYTEVRYVSRIRNAPKGTVKTQSSKTIFVSPLKVE